jgi:hypothetical protein
MSKSWVEVHFGAWTCQWCGARWAGRWNGPKHLLTCLVCEQRIYDDKGKRVEPERVED